LGVCKIGFRGYSDCRQHLPFLFQCSKNWVYYLTIPLPKGLDDLQALMGDAEIKIHALHGRGAEINLHALHGRDAEISVLGRDAKTVLHQNLEAVKGQVDLDPVHSAHATLIETAILLDLLNMALATMKANLLTELLDLVTVTLATSIVLHDHLVLATMRIRELLDMALLAVLTTQKAAVVPVPLLPTTKQHPPNTTTGSEREIDFSSHLVPL